MASAKQAILPLWGSAATARAVQLAASSRLAELLLDFVTADASADEARMDEITLEMQRVVGHIRTFKRRRFSKWAKEREAQRR